MVHDIAVRVAGLLPALAGAVSWVVTAALSGVIGLVVGAITIPVAEHLLAPVAKAVTGMFRRKA